MEEFVYLLCAPLLVSGLISFLSILKSHRMFKDSSSTLNKRIHKIAFRPRKIYDKNHKIYYFNDLMIPLNSEDEFNRTWQTFLNNNLNNNIEQ